MFSWYYIEGILIQSCYTLLIVLGLSILTGYTGMFSFGHAGFVCIGAYVSILCTMAFGLPYWLSLIIAGLAAMLLGAGLGKITLNLKGDYFCIATLGVGEAIRLIFNNLQLTINVGGKDFLLDGAKGVASIPLKTTLFGDWNALSNGDVGTFLSTLFSSALFIVIIFLCIKTNICSSVIFRKVSQIINKLLLLIFLTNLHIIFNLNTTNSKFHQNTTDKILCLSSCL